MVQVSKSIFRWGGVGGVKGRPHHLLGHTALDDLGDLGRVARVEALVLGQYVPAVHGEHDGEQAGGGEDCGGGG